MATVEQVAVPPQDGVRGVPAAGGAAVSLREVVEQAGKDRAVGAGEHGPADLALQDEQQVPQRKDLHAFIATAQRQQAQERQSTGRGEEGQAQQHDRP
ncbi:hypothetical protein ACFRIB_46530 [Streptomyces mirabilis]|uniref:hypothetical protein n=1 Tax=Streptomyces mirabilis TaxID=68239 RepID=UPI003681B0C6